MIILDRTKHFDADETIDGVLAVSIVEFVASDGVLLINDLFRSDLRNEFDVVLPDRDVRSESWPVEDLTVVDDLIVIDEIIRAYQCLISVNRYDNTNDIVRLTYIYLLPIPPSACASMGKLSALLGMSSLVTVFRFSRMPSDLFSVALESA